MTPSSASLPGRTLLSAKELAFLVVTILFWAAFVIVLEMTANQQMTIPIMATSLLALGFSRLVCRRPLYGTLAQRFLRTTEPAPEKL